MNEDLCAVRAETTTALILERADPIILKTFPEIKAFRLIPVIRPARTAKPENHLKRELVPDRAYSAIKSVNIQEFFGKKNPTPH